MNRPGQVAMDNTRQTDNTCTHRRIINVEHCWRAGPWRIVLQNAPIMLCHNSLKIPLGLVLYFKTVETSLVREGGSCWKSLAVERHSYLPTLHLHAHKGSEHQKNQLAQCSRMRAYLAICFAVGDGVEIRGPLVCNTYLLSPMDIMYVSWWANYCDGQDDYTSIFERPNDTTPYNTFYCMLVLTLVAIVTDR